MATQESKLKKLVKAVQERSLATLTAQCDELISKEKRKLEDLISKENRKLEELISKLLKEALFEAVRRGLGDQVDLLLSKGANIHARDDKGDSAIILAARGGHCYLVSRLISKGADMQDKNVKNETPVYVASRNGHLTIVEHLISQGANIHDKNVKRCSCLMAASHKRTSACRRIPTVPRCEDQRKSINNTSCLWVASQNGHLPAVKYLLCQGANIHDKNDRGESPIMTASRFENVDVVALLYRKELIFTIEVMTDNVLVLLKLLAMR